MQKEDKDKLQQEIEDYLLTSDYNDEAGLKNRINEVLLLQSKNKTYYIHTEENEEDGYYVSIQFPLHMKHRNKTYLGNHGDHDIWYSSNRSGGGGGSFLFRINSQLDGYRSLQDIQDKEVLKVAFERAEREDLPIDTEDYIYMLDETVAFIGLNTTVKKLGYTKTSVCQWLGKLNVPRREAKQTIKTLYLQQYY